jgi:membrane protease subunit HflK
MAWDWDKLQQQKKGGSGGGGGGATPQIGDIINRIRGTKGKFPLWIIILVILIIYLGISMFYTVAVDEVGVIQRFGRFRTIRADVRTRFASGSAYLSESLMLTGDLNVAVVPWVVQYRVKDPYNYLFKVRDVRATLRDLSESTMRLVVGDRSITEVISKRGEIADQAKVQLQRELDEAETGISLTTIELQKTNVPEPVQPSFNEVNQATQEKEKMIYQAREAYNKIIPQARGSAEKTVKSAEGYALDRVNRAKGDGARFLALYEEYSKAEDVTKRRLYLETIREVFPKLGDKYIVDADQRNLLPLLNLGRPKGGK